MVAVLRLSTAITWGTVRNLWRLVPWVGFALDTRVSIEASSVVSEAAGPYTTSFSSDRV